MKEVVATGATVEEAVKNGCQELGLKEDQIEYEVIEMPQPKKFGIFGGTLASVKVKEKLDPETVALNYLTDILTAMNVRDLGISVETTPERVIFNINGNDKDLGMVIGRRGDTLSALQYLVSLASNNVGEEYFKVSLNVKNFREKREHTLENMAAKVSYKAIKLQKNIALEHMSPYERSIIHTAVQSIDGVTSWSIGENEKRHVVIGPEGLNEGEDGIPEKYAKLHDNRGKGGNRRGGYNGNSRYRKNYNSQGRGGYRGNNYSDEGDDENRGEGRGYRGGRSRSNYGSRGNYSRNGYSGRRNNYNGYSRAEGEEGGYQSYDKDEKNRETPAATAPKSDYDKGARYGKIDVKNTSSGNDSTEENN